ncbi:Kinesin-like protein KIF15-A [Acipenser ruthenus]|uniref:Kinesin-like protein KIF15-A n=1 Tax=Acipenser ruthenus TaxID=7906 RepID=A0A444TZ94_ACIRT|nr:Kinesin-like protein KIF15-A [Acipenser ruthenus]
MGAGTKGDADDSSQLVSNDGDAIKVFVRVRPLAQGSGLSTDGDQNLCLTVTSFNTIRLHSKPEPRIFTYDHVADMDVSQADKSFLCKCSFIEIYNEQIFDLLDSASASLFLRENMKKGVFVDGAVEKVVTSAAEAYQVLSMGWRNRRVASTSMNRESSRSHAVFTVTVESKEKINEIVNIRSSQLNLVDLAGSERQKDTHTEGTRLKEAGSINRSLSCLGQVIMALVDVSNGKSRHICYRDSKLTFLLRDSLGGNAKTFIIANVHPGSKCFGETLSTLQFAQRAKLIKNKAVVNEDTQGNVSQLQAEVRKLKEQLSQLMAGQIPQGVTREIPQGASGTNDAEPAGVSSKEYRNNFLEAMLFWEKSESEKKNLLQKVAQLEDAWAKKERFIQSTRMIVKFREEHIARLEKTLKESGRCLDSDEKDAVIDHLKQEIKALREQVDQHPRVAKYATENHSLREENKQLRSLESVKRAKEINTQIAAELEKAFLEADKGSGVLPVHSTPITAENVSSVSMERLKAQLMQKQSELTTTVQAYEEFKELTKKKQLEMESELRYLEKSNQHLENILEATKTYKRQEVSQLNKMHVETIKNLTTPTKAYRLRSRLVPHLNADRTPDCNTATESTEEQVDYILNEPVPPGMNEMAYEAIAEELQMVQEQANTLQAKLDEEEAKNMKLLQQISKLEGHSSQMQQLFSSERANWSKEQQDHHDQIKSLEKELLGEQSKNDGKLEHESLLEEKRSLQDAHDNLQEVMKYESEEYKQRLAESVQEKATLQAELHEVVADLMNQTQVLRTSLNEKTQMLALHLSELGDIQTKYHVALTATEESKGIIEKQEKEISDLKEIMMRKTISNTIEQELLQDDLTHTTEEMEKLTEAYNKQTALLQAVQAEAIVRETTIKELQEKLIQKEAEQENIKKENDQKQTEAVPAELPQTPRTPNSFSTDLSKVLEGQERELQNRRSSMVTLEMLVTELNSERVAKNDEILRLKGQLCEVENLRLEMQTWVDRCHKLQQQAQGTGSSSDEKNKKSDHNQSNEVIKELAEERKAKNSAMRQLGELEAELQGTSATLAQAQICIQSMTCDLKGKSLELKELQEKEIQQDKLLKELEVLRKQVMFLTEENGKLVGHQNLNQKIQYLMELKKKNTKLIEENEKLRLELIAVKENCKKE